MKKNLLNHYVIALLKSIELDLMEYLKTRKPSALHRLRVDIKKMKAIISFAEKIYKEKYDKQKLKPLFKQAGRIREVQINSRLLSSFSPPPQRLISRLKTKENSLVQQFIKNSQRYIEVLKKLRVNTFFPAKLPPKRVIIRYFNKEINKAGKDLKKKNRDGLHGYRVRIKKLMYVYQVLPKRIQNDINLDEAAIDKQQKKLGVWHDTYAALSFLSGEQCPNNANGYVATLMEKESRQFNSLEEKLIRKK